ncbi:hypothetical protein C922_02940 [Plasmodium inui San Antonio 1]|uniref:Uncharacterized protein n=1 Tax=Plasmodium inui San Antonio 1 TaxID=1237626 RepID=W7AC17_9APIC|nr:hypothetical protein C922_02940 [Plasmodium inui San Antonio 1]EUD66619.1 hypothetical protein C922_02940 [Plasmodium inui San Antonio 1]
MKIRNYIFGRVTDPYSYLEKIKGLLELPSGKNTNKWKVPNFVQNCVRRYDEEVAKKSYRIKYDVHASLREDFLPSEGNTNEELLFHNRYLYFEYNTDKNLLVCRKKIKRRSRTNNSFHHVNKSLDDLKREGYVSRDTSEIVAVLPTNCLIKSFCTKGNRFFAFVVERSDCYLNWGYVFRGSRLVRDAKLDHLACGAVSREGPSPRENGRRCPFRGRPPEGGPSRSVQRGAVQRRSVKRIPRNGAHHFADHSNCPRSCLPYHHLLYQREGVQNIAFLQRRRSTDLSPSHFSAAHFSPAHFFPPDFLTTELDEKHRCSGLFLNTCSCTPPRKKLLLFEADEKNFLNIYLSKDMKRIFLLSGNHHTNDLFLIQCKDKSRKGTLHYELRLIKLVGKALLRGKYFLEHFRHHVILIGKGDDRTEVYALDCDALHLHPGQLGRVKNRGKEKISFPTHSVHITKEEVPINGCLRRMITLQNCTLHDFDMTKYGLVLYTYRYFLKPIICLLYLFVKQRGGIAHWKENTKENRLVAKMKILSVPITKGSIECGLNNLFQSHLISVYICNPFVSRTQVVVDLRRGVVALPRNVQRGEEADKGEKQHNWKKQHNSKKEKNSKKENNSKQEKNPTKEKNRTRENPNGSFFRAKNRILYDLQLEDIFAKNKEYKIKDIFIRTQEGTELPLTLIYRHTNNANLCDIQKEPYKSFSKHVEEEYNSFTVTATSFGNLCVHFFHSPRWSLDIGVQVDEPLPLFIKPSRTIINVYPFYRQLNICSYSDESHFYILNNFIVVYFHLTGSGGLQCGKRNTLYRSATLDKFRTIRDLTDSINCLKHLNVSETESMSIYLHSNSGLLGGYLLNGQRKFLQNIILINPMMDFFNNLTDEKKPHVHSERLEFGCIDPEACLLRRGGATLTTGRRKRGRGGNPQRKGGGTPPQGRHNKSIGGRNRIWTSQRSMSGTFVPPQQSGTCQSKPHIGIRRQCQKNLLLLHALCPYNNIQPTCSEVFSPPDQSDQSIPFKLSVTTHRDNLFTSAVLLYLNKYDIICPNVNSVKYFLKYTHYQRVHVRFGYCSFGSDYVGGSVNFLNFHSVDRTGEGQKKPLYISFSEQGGHGGVADYDSLLRRTLGRMHFHLVGERHEVS